MNTVSSAAAPRRLFHWGVGIACTYALFAGATLAFVFFALTQRVELVSDDYYGESLSYDQRIAATREADRLGSAFRCVRSDDGRSLIVQLPAAQVKSASGKVRLYRPSDVDADRIVKLAVDDGGTQRISVEGLRQGRWKVQVDWQAEGRHFYREEVMDLP